MTYNFDEIIDRHGFSSYKTDLAEKVFGTSDLLPLWVADMDFRTPDFAMNAINERCKHEIMGYTIRDRDFFATAIAWLQTKHQWEINADWIDFIAGVVPAIALAINTYTKEGDAVLVQTPVYPPFMMFPRHNNRKLICNELLLRNGQYEIDFELFERQIRENAVKMFILCSPHNPGGRVWRLDELQRIDDICRKYGVLVISDEIHADLALYNHKHIPFATVSDSARENSVTFMAPSKTFNMPGLASSFYVIPNHNLRRAFGGYIDKLDCRGGNIFAYVATKAVYTQGAEWLAQLVEYLQGNIEFVADFLQKNLPAIKPIIPQASFLLWLDFRELGLKDDELQAFLVKKAKIGLNAGTTFGPGGSGFARLNVATPRSVLEEAMTRLKCAMCEVFFERK
ncbi:aminotransferase [Bacteroidia bacterium]|nr:aminotransferase [Bacteroidia bacterium]